MITFNIKFDGDRRKCAHDFLGKLMEYHDKGEIHIHMQAMVCWFEMAQNTADHTECEEAIFCLSQDGEKGGFTYLDDGSGPKEPIDWCVAENNSTGNPEHNSGLGMPWILDIGSKPFDMKVEIVSMGSFFGYTGSFPLERQHAENA